MIVTVNGLDFHTSGDKGLVIAPGGFKGWDGGVAMRRDVVPRPQAAGSFRLPGFPDSRTVSLEGNAFATSNQELLEIGRSLTGLFADGQPGKIQVTRHGEVQWAPCELVMNDFVDTDGGCQAPFQLQLWNPDPAKFSAKSRHFTASVGAPVNVYHRGNYGAIPTIIVRGDMPGGYSVTLNGWDFTVPVACVTGVPHRIEYSDGSVYRNGVPYEGALGNTNTTLVPPGPAVALGLYPISGGTGTAELIIPDTYL